MNFVDGHFQTEKITDLTNFARFLERYDILILKKEIKAKNGNVLVQAERTLTEKFLKSLLTRDDIEIDTYIVKNTENLKGAIVSRIAKEMESKMDLAEFSFCAYLLNKKTVDIRRIIRAALNFPFFVGYVADLLLNDKAIKEHLIEVALTSVGLVNALTQDIAYSDLMKLFIAAFLHDYTLTDERLWEPMDSFTDYNEHDKKSAMALSDKELPPEVSELILINNKLKIAYQGNYNETWYNDNKELMGTVLNLAEYFTFLKREAKAEHKEGDETPTVVYQLSLCTEKGYFPRNLISLFEKHYSQYNQYFQYGRAIGNVESKCLLTDLAKAYPKPKSTQLLCYDSSKPCKHRIYSQPLKVVTDNIGKGKIFEYISTGWYDKCDFVHDLPTPPENF